MEVVKVKRKSLSMKQKLAVISELDKGVKHTEIAKAFELPRTTITPIAKTKNTILANSIVFNSKVKKARGSLFPKTDAALLKWLDVQRSNKVPIPGPILLAQAKVIADRVGESEFKGTSGWLDKWKKRNGLSYQTVSGEAGAVNSDIVSNWLKNVWPREREGYADKDVFNGDETGLFYKLLPNKTYGRKGLVCTGGKLSKERLTVLLCSNADGSEKLKPVLIGKSENPRCFKTIKKKTLPVHYYFNSKAWMTREIFSDWIKKIDLQLRFQKRKILLLLDNCKPHKISVKTHNIKIVFFPPNVTSILQPMDQEIINETNKMYRTLIVKKIIERIEKNEEYKIDVLEAILNLATAWTRVSPLTLKNCFRHSKVSSTLECNADQEDETDEVDEIVSESEFGRLSADVVDFNEYVNADSQVITTAAVTDDEILEVNPSDSPILDESDGDEDPEIDRPVISTAQALQHVGNLKLWFMGRDDDESIFFNHINGIENIVVKAKIKSLKQSVIQDYFVAND